LAQREPIVIPTERSERSANTVRISKDEQSGLLRGIAVPDPRSVVARQTARHADASRGRSTNARAHRCSGNLNANPAASSDANASVVHEPRIAILPLAFEGAKATAIAGAVPARKPGRRAMSLRGAAPSVALGARSAVAQ